MALPSARVAGAARTAHARPGERFQAGLGRPPRSLKKQYQAAGVPAWQRSGPLVYSGGVPVFVPGSGIDARASRRGEPQVGLAWLPAERRRRPESRARGRRLESRSPAGARAGSAGRNPPSPMALIVHKYGGTSMGSPERIRSVAKRVAKWARPGTRWSSCRRR